MACACNARVHVKTSTNTHKCASDVLIACVPEDTNKYQIFHKVSCAEKKRVFETDGSMRKPRVTLRDNIAQTHYVKKTQRRNTA